MTAALEALERGEVVAAATESSYGLLVDAMSAVAIDALHSIKPREGKAPPLILPNLESWRRIASPSALAEQLARAFWPGPLTVACEAVSVVDPRLIEDGRVAVRLAGPCQAADVAASFGRPVTATSANRPGESPCATHAHVIAAFGGFVGSGLTVLNGTAGGGLPSTVVVAHADRIRVVRVGAVSLDALRETLGSGVVVDAG